MGTLRKVSDLSEDPSGVGGVGVSVSGDVLHKWIVIWKSENIWR